MRRKRIIEWTKDFSINNKKLDSQHKIIFDICNVVNDIALRIEENPESIDYYKEKLKQVVLKLFEYIRIHLQDEEEFMKRIDFPLIEEHKKAHTELIQRTKRIISHFNNAKELVQELQYLTKYWILNHFFTHDMWICNYTRKAIHLNEIHFSLPMYIKIKSIEKDLSLEENFEYICVCLLKIHKVPQTIHKELKEKKMMVKCEECHQILVHFESKYRIQDYDTLNKQYAKFAELI